MIRRAQTAIGEAAPWLVATTVLALGFVFYDDLKAVFGGKAQRLSAAQTFALGATEASPQQSSSTGLQRVALHASSDGHVYAEAQINGTATRVMIDTGATIVAMTYRDAQRAGIKVSDRDFTHRVATANGIAGFAPIYLKQVTVGTITVHNVRAAIARPGTLRTTLLGMTFLNRLSNAEMRDGVLVLKK